MIEIRLSERKTRSIVIKCTQTQFDDFHRFASEYANDNISEYFRETAYWFDKMKRSNDKDVVTGSNNGKG